MLGSVHLLRNIFVNFRTPRKYPTLKYVPQIFLGKPENKKALNFQNFDIFSCQIRGQIIILLAFSFL